MNNTIALHPLNGAFERVIRAGEHLADLRPRIGIMRQLQEQATTAYFETEPPHQFAVALPISVQAPARIPVLVGEIAYNLRSALDYLIFELAKLDSGIPQKGTQFPIVNTPKQFASNTTTARLNGVSAAHVAVIERLQPYNGVDWPKFLRDISNPDKHREFVVMKANQTIVAYTPIDPEYPALDLPIRRTPHPIAGEVHVKVDITVDILFADGTPVIETLEKLILNVRQTLTDFQPEF